MWVLLFVVAVVGATSRPPKSCPFAAKPAKDIDCGAHATFVLCPPNCPRSDNCSNLWSKIACKDDGCCYPACRCDKGYLRDGTGKCVTVQECMNIPNRPCTPNEVRVPCPITCPPQSCDSDYVSYLCAQKSDEVPCEPGCNCKDQYKRDTQGLCIPVEECPPPPWFVKPRRIPKSTPKPVNPITCGPNEEKKDCRTICPPQNCDISYTDYACNKTIPCEPGCDCIKDYLRDINGVCVLNDKCPPPPTTKPPVEENTPPTEPTKIVSSSKAYSKSFSSSSSSISSSASSSKSSKSFKNKPKPQKCGVNEKWVSNRTICPPQSCAISYTSYTCDPSPPREPGCDCIENYLRDNNGVCVLNENCPPPPVVTETPATETPQICPPLPGPDKPKPQKCGVNEKWVSNRTICPPQSCAISYTSYICEPSPPREPGCDCIENYLRDNNGVCVLNENCPPPPVVTETPVSEQPQTCPPAPEPAKDIDCGAHASFVLCPPNCPRSDNCSNLWSKFACKDDGCCYPACRCDDGYLRDGTGKCVTVQECMNIPNRPCTPNEVRVPCPITCPPQSCDSDYVSYLCAQISDEVPCEPGCNCKDQYKRDTQGLCIPVEECPPPPWFIQPMPIPKTTPKPVNPITCGPNEERKDCRTICPPQNCNISYTDYACDKKIPCEPGCDCIKDYLRDFNGVCVLNDKCPPPPVVTEIPVTVAPKICPPAPEPAKDIDCGAHASYVLCPPNCPRSDNCSKLWTKFACEDDGCCYPACRCDDGYLRDGTGKCVTVQQCTSKCGANQTEVPCKVECPDSYCPENDNRGILICDPPRPCPSGCVCSLGYRRKSYKNPTCILAEECPPVACTRQNEEWNSCPSCLAEDCGDVNNQPSVCNELVHNCNPKCVCRKGFFRNGTGDCVPASECPPPVEITTLPPEASQCSVNQTYVNCNVGCPTNNCPTSDTRAIVACSQPYPCPPGCACKVGYRRKSFEDKSCILAEECTPVKCTRPHEKWNPCPSPCLAERCGDQNNPPVICNELIKNCQPKCVCEDGYYRNENDICVPANQCPNKECPANQTYVTCNVRCPTEDCPVSDNRFMFACAISYPCDPGCACSPGYRRESSAVDNCIRAEDCPPVTCTRQNEEYNRCPSPCRSEYCRDANKPPGPCNSLVNGCDPKCVCKEGFFRNGTDDCVPVNECPPECNTNEMWNTCPAPCLAEYCLDSKNPPLPCDSDRTVCQPARCVCKPGFFRDDSGTCVPFSECGKGLCNANETYAFCKAGCPYDFCPENDSRDIIACDPPYPCPKGCICKRNYKKRSYQDQTCIRVEECPPVKCTRPNEKWDPCTSSCLAESCRDYLNPPGVCNEFVKSCQPKCVCEKGFYRNDDDICVPAEQCGAKQCGKNETYADCNFAFPPDFCPANDEQVTYACKPPRDCPPGCKCKLNYKWRSYEDKTCVLARDCQPVNCTRPNEEWNPCTTSCLAEKCEDYLNPAGDCNEFVENCQPKCVCKKGFYRNQAGDCIPAKKCGVKKCGVNETLSDCGFGCPQDYCPKNDNLVKILCKPPRDCAPGCKCKFNYKWKSSKDKTCVLAEDCKPVNCTRQNEKWAKCPSPCLLESCEDVNNQPKTCNYLVHDCEPRCICEKGFFRNTDEICIRASKCQPVNCTRQNEKWEKCPSPCLRESCEDVNNQPKTCNYLVHNCQPRCICEKGFFRNKDNMCVRASKCPKKKIKLPHQSVTPAEDI